MAYIIEHEWEKGQTITAEKLNHMERGIAAALGAIEGAFGKTYNDGSNEKYTVSLENLGSSRNISAGAIQGTSFETTGASVLKGNVTIGTTDTAVDTTINGKLIVNGKYDDSSPAVLEAATLTGKVNISGDTVVNGNIIVGDTTTNNSIKNKIYGTTTLFGKLEVQSNGSLTVNGNSFINSNFYHQVNQAHENDGSLTWFPDSVFYAYYKTIILGAKGEMISPDQPGKRIISEDNSSTISLSGRLLTISNTTTNIQSAYTNIKGYVTIGSEPTNNIYADTLIVNANSTLRGTTTIDKLAQLIVGDASTTTIENKIYGHTAISNLTTPRLVVGKAAYVDDEEVEHAATGLTFLYGTTNTDNLIVGNIAVDNDTIIYTGTTAFNTTVNILHGTTTIDKLDKIIVGDADTASNIENKIYGTTTIYNTLQIGTYGVQDFWPNPEAPRIEQFGVQGTLKIFSNIQIGLTGDEEGRGTRELVNTNIRIHGNTAIDNLTIKDELALTDGTDTVTLTIEDLQQLKDLLTESNGGETP